MELEIWITGVCSSHDVSLCDFAYYVVGYEPVVAMNLTLCYIVFACHQNDFCKDYFGSVYVGGYGGLSERRCMCAHDSGVM